MKHQTDSPKQNATALSVHSCFENNEIPEHSVGSKPELQSVQNKALNSIPQAATHFNELPDCAYVRLPTVMVLFGCSKPTAWRWVKSARIPAPVKLGNRLSAWQVGSLRAYLRQIEAEALNALERGGEQ